MLAAALILDALLGEPDWLWRRVRHPVVVIGALISALEQRLNGGQMRRVKGFVTVVALLATTLPLPILVWYLPYGWLIEIGLGAVLLAHRSLVQHVDAVAEGLGRSLHDGRSAVAQIVGRDPESLDEAGVSRAAIESAAENFSDGVVAPAFWFALCGLPGIVAYKVINTADSMIGHRSPRYVDFGWAAARLDDVLNWIPARLTGYLFLIVGGRLDAAAHMHRDAPGHRSPNAGWPEAAMAHVLGIALAGPRIYGGSLTEDPFMNPDGRREAMAQEIRRSVSMLWRAWAGLFGVAALAAGLSVLV